MQDLITFFCNLDWKTILSTSIPLVVLVVSPFLSLYIAKKQISATIVANARKEWINEFRSAISKFMAASMRGTLMQTVEATKEERYNHSHDLFYLGNQIELMLNRENPLHLELDKKLNDGVLLIIDQINKPFSRNDTFPSLFAEIKSLSVKIIQEENRILKTPKRLNS